MSRLKWVPAEVSNLDLAEDFPEIIIDNCDQAPFFALVLEQALRDIGRINLWSSLLAEAALRSRIVAKILSDNKPSELLENSVQAIPRKARWFQRGILNKSLYTQLLTIAVNLKYSLALLSCLDILKKIPAPGYYSLESYYMIFIAFFSFLCLCSIILFKEIPVRLPINRNNFYFSYLSIFLCVYFLTIYSTFRVINIKRFYRAILLDSGISNIEYLFIWKGRSFFSKISTPLKLKKAMTELVSAE